MFIVTIFCLWHRWFCKTFYSTGNYFHRNRWFGNPKIWKKDKKSKKGVFLAKSPKSENLGAPKSGGFGDFFDWKKGRISDLEKGSISPGRFHVYFQNSPKNTFIKRSPGARIRHDDFQCVFWQKPSKSEMRHFVFCPICPICPDFRKF